MAADATPMSADQLDVVSHLIIGAGQAVSGWLGYGFLEKVYENALTIEVKKRGLSVEQQQPVCVTYDGQIVGSYQPDLVVADSILVEVKAVETLSRAHRQQCINYLKATGYRVCLLMNFGQPRLEVRRLVWRF